jgi:hypothetical protein
MEGVKGCFRPEEQPSRGKKGEGQGEEESGSGHRSPEALSPGAAAGPEGFTRSRVNHGATVKVLLVSANMETMNIPPLPQGLACVAAATRRAGTTWR